MNSGERSHRCASMSGKDRQGCEGVVKRCQSMRTTESNQPVLVTTARVRFGLDLKNPVWAAARDGGRWTANRVEP
jgi:hypothetical protein